MDFLPSVTHLPEKGRMRPPPGCRINNHGGGRIHPSRVPLAAGSFGTLYSCRWGGSAAVVKVTLVPFAEEKFAVVQADRCSLPRSLSPKLEETKKGCRRMLGEEHKGNTPALVCRRHWPINAQNLLTGHLTSNKMALFFNLVSFAILVGNLWALHLV